MSPKLSLALLCLAILGAPTALAAGSSARGRAIAAKNCQRCHAIDPAGASTNPKSPPFRTLSQRYPLDELEEALGEGIMVGHEGLEMPLFRLRPTQIDDLMAYLRRIQTKKRR